MMLEEYRQGSCYPILQGEDATVIDYTPSGLTLYIRYGNMKKDEIIGIKNGPLSYGCYWDGEVIYFLFRFGAAQWIDAPYHKNLTLDQSNIVKFSDENEHEALLIIAGEATTGECKAIRLVALDRDFSNKIRELIAMQSDDITADKIYEHIGNTYAKCQTTEMVKEAEKKGEIY